MLCCIGIIYGLVSIQMSHNIDENAMLKYVCFCFQIWGINTLSKDTLKKCRQNSPECQQALTTTLFHLSILQIIDFSHTITELGIVLPDSEQSEQFMQEFVLAYLSEANCPFLYQGAAEGRGLEGAGDGEGEGEVEHGLDFGNTRVLVLVVGWLMAMVDFFGQIRGKYVARKFNDLYIDKKPLRKTQPQPQSLPNPKSHLSQSFNQPLPQTFKSLQNLSYRIECLSHKKSQILSKLSKQLTQFNKKNQTNYKIQQILQEGTRNQEEDMEMERQEEDLEAVLMEVNKGMKYQQYFWIWLQFKVGEKESKELEQQFQDVFQKVQGDKPPKWQKLNPDYLSMYNKQYKAISARMQSLSQYMQQIQPMLDSAKPVKNESAIRKQVTHQFTKILHQSNPELLQSIGTPCFLKLQVKKYFQKHGFGSKQKKQRKKQPTPEETPPTFHQQLQLQEEIKQFLENLDQLKFL